MKTELDEALCRDFPLLYKDRHNDKTCMIYGFSCGDGWESIIRKLSEKLERMIIALPEDEKKNYYATQVKEKFGGLRCYMSRQTPEMTQVITEAEDECWKTCETCGKPGKSVSHRGWLRTSCEECEKKRINV